MKKLRVLHIEHDKDYRDQVELELKKENIEVDPIASPADIKKNMKERNYDVVLTDVMWPENEDDEYEKKERLGEVIYNVRQDDAFIPIIALSRKEDSHNVAMQYKDEIYDIWAKTTGYPQFLIYRLKNLVKNQQNLHGEETLIRETLKVIEENQDAWIKDEIQKLCNDISKVQGLGFLLRIIRDFYEDLSNKLGLSVSFLEKVFRNFLNAEPIDLARNAKSWGHLRHSLSVFLAGYILLNEKNNILKVDELRRDMELGEQNKLNEIWFIACAFHDTATYYEHIPEVLKLIKEICPDSREKEIIGLTNGDKIDLSKINKWKIEYKASDEDIIKDILKSTNKSDMTPKVINHKSGNIDHGLIAAVILYYNSYRYPDKDVLAKASYIILMHNCFEKIKDTYNEKDDVLFQLFCILDNLQAWGRENKYEGILNSNQFRNVVLRKFNRTINPVNGKRELEIKIDYIPFRTSSPGDELHKDNEKNLISTLRKVIEKLEKVGLKNDNGELYWNNTRINISFCIHGRRLNVYNRVSSIN